MILDMPQDVTVRDSLRPIRYKLEEIDAIQRFDNFHVDTNAGANVGEQFRVLLSLLRDNQVSRLDHSELNFYVIAQRL
jgi:hypothetical protein